MRKTGYWRLFELHNEAWWPLQPAVLVAAAALLLWGLLRPDSPAPRLAAAGLAAAWALAGIGFLWQRYAPINWAATAFAAGFVVQSAGLAALASAAPLRIAGPGWRRRAGAGLCAWALLAQPLLAPITGRPWAQAEVFGLAPDPTVFATLGFLLLLAPASPPPWRWLRTALWLPALAWCTISAATLWTMGSLQGWVPAAAAMAALAARWAVRPRSTASRMRPSRIDDS